MANWGHAESARELGNALAGRNYDGEAYFEVGKLLRKMKQRTTIPRPFYRVFHSELTPSHQLKCEAVANMELQPTRGVDIDQFEAETRATLYSSVFGFTAGYAAVWGFFTYLALKNRGLRTPWKRHVMAGGTSFVGTYYNAKLRLQDSMIDMCSDAYSKTGQEIMECVDKVNPQNKLMWGKQIGGIHPAEQLWPRSAAGRMLDPIAFTYQLNSGVPAEKLWKTEWKRELPADSHGPASTIYDRIIPERLNLEDLMDLYRTNPGKWTKAWVWELQRNQPGLFEIFVRKVANEDRVIKLGDGRMFAVPKSTSAQDRLVAEVALVNQLGKGDQTWKPTSEWAKFQYELTPPKEESSEAQAE